MYAVSLLVSRQTDSATRLKTGQLSSWKSFNHEPGWRARIRSINILGQTRTVYLFPHIDTGTNRTVIFAHLTLKRCATQVARFRAPSLDVMRNSFLPESVSTRIVNSKRMVARKRLKPHSCLLAISVRETLSSNQVKNAIGLHELMISSHLRWRVLASGKR